MTAPSVLRSSGLRVPSVRGSGEPEPLLPSAATRTASSAASSEAALMSLVSCCSSFSMSDISWLLSPSWPGFMSRPSTSCFPKREGVDARNGSGYDAERLGATPTSGRRRQRGLGLLHDRLERRRLGDGEVRQDLAIDRDAGLGEAVDESAVVEAKGPHRGVEALDPERPEGALAALAVAVGVLLRLLHRLLGNADGVPPPAVVAFGGLVDFLVLGVSGDATFDAGHDRSPCGLLKLRWACALVASAVWQPIFLDVVTIRLEQDVGAAELADLLLGPLDHAVPLAGLGVEHLPRAGDLEALLGARLGLDLGHLALLWRHNGAVGP